MNIKNMRNILGINYIHSGIHLRKTLKILDEMCESEIRMHFYGIENNLEYIDC